MSSKETAELVLSKVLTFLAFFLSNVLVAVRYFYTNYPETARVLSMLVAAYVLFKSFMRILRFWWGMLKFVAKVVLIFLLVVVASCAYYRGPHRFFTRDIPFIYLFWQLVSQKQQEAFQNSINYADILGQTGLDPVALQKGATGWISDNAEHIETFKDGAMHFAAENFDHVQNFVKANNLQNLFNLGYDGRI